MSYKQTLDFLFSQLPMYQREGKSAYKANLNTTIELDRYFDSPHKCYKTIHVAGTNGKGSVSHMLASVLKCEGYKVGLYTSPHLKDFRERIKIDGEMVSKDFVVDFVSDFNDIILKLKPSFFEITVAMAFEYFKKQNVDIAVIETGMGGRLDSTNIITPLISVITNIGLDHTAFLGKTLPLIANEKAGIIKKDIPVVVGRKNLETDSVFINRAKEIGTSVTFASECFDIEQIDMSAGSGSKDYFIINKSTQIINKYTSDLAGVYQNENIVTVLCAIQKLRKQLRITDDSIKNGLSKVKSSTGFMGRWQVLQNKPLIVTDTGHNYDGLKMIFNQINSIKYDNLHIVMGVVNDKDIEVILELFPTDAKYYFTKASIPRALNEDKLMQIANKHGLFGDSYPSVKLAYESAKLNLKENDMMFVGGSTFVVAEIV